MSYLSEYNINMKEILIKMASEDPSFRKSLIKTVQQREKGEERDGLLRELLAMKDEKGDHPQD